MSSTWRVLCLSHDPATWVTMDGHHRDAEALAAVAEMRDNDNDEHHLCNLLVGAYSYPLWHVICPGTPRGVAETHGCRHAHPKGVDVEWLQLLAAADQHRGTEPIAAALGKLPSCWSPERVHRLRKELT